MNYKNALITISIVLTVSIAAFMTLSSYDTPERRSKKQTQLPDAFMETVNAVILDKSGKINIEIVSPKMIHFSKNDTTDFIDPQLTFHHKSPQPWYIESKFAKAIHGINNVVFKENVLIHHPADTNNPATLIKTSSLVVHPIAQTAETKDLITMEQPNSTIKAIGMFADMNSGSIKLLSEAQGEYEPDV